MLREEKRSIINGNMKNYPGQVQHHVTGLKIELLVKIVNDCKLLSQKNYNFRCVTCFEFVSDYNESMFLANNERAISPFFGMVALTTYSRFYVFKIKNRNTKNTRV